MTAGQVWPIGPDTKYKRYKQSTNKQVYLMVRVDGWIRVRSGAYKIQSFVKSGRLRGRQIEVCLRSWADLNRFKTIPLSLQYFLFCSLCLTFL